MKDAVRQKAIDILTNQEKINCPKLLEQFVWANTMKPKFKRGDPVIFRSPSTNIVRGIWSQDGSVLRQGARVERAVGCVIDITRSLNEQTYFYTIEYKVDLEGGKINGETITTHIAHAYEINLTEAPSCSVNKWSELGRTWTE